MQTWFAGTVRDQGFDVPLDNPPPPMFTPFRIGNMVVQNRVVVSPMNMYSAEPGGIPGDFHLVHLGRFGMGGAGSGLRGDDRGVGAGPHHARMPGHLFGRSRSRPGSASATSSTAKARRNSACSSAIPAARARPSSVGRAWIIPLDDGNWELVARVAAWRSTNSCMFRARSRARDMERVRDDYAHAAVNADKAGFDMIEVHAGHGYLLSGFISPLSNQRKDDYGGSLENRMRFPLESFRRREGQLAEA